MGQLCDLLQGSGCKEYKSQGMRRSSGRDIAIAHCTAPHWGHPHKTCTGLHFISTSPWTERSCEFPPHPQGSISNWWFLGLWGQPGNRGGHFLHWCSHCRVPYAVNTISGSHAKGRRESGEGPAGKKGLSVERRTWEWGMNEWTSYKRKKLSNMFRKQENKQNTYKPKQKAFLL